MALADTLWRYLPNYSDSPIDHYEWLTDVIESRTGFEQRIGLRIAPRRTIKSSYLIAEFELGKADAQFFARGAMPFILPIGFDVTELTANISSGSHVIFCDASGYEFFVGGYVCVGIDMATAEVLTITALLPNGVQTLEAVTRKHSTGEKVWPARTARITGDVQQTWPTSSVATMTITFEILDQAEIIYDAPVYAQTGSGNSFNGGILLNKKQNWKDAVSRSYTRRLVILDNTTGFINWIDKTNWSHGLKTVKVTLPNTSDRRSFLGFISQLNGRRSPFWREDSERFIHLSDNAPPVVTNMLRIKPIGYATLLLNTSGRLAVAVGLRDGTTQYRTITNCTVDAPTGDEVITLNSPLAPIVNKQDILYISYLELVRLTADVVEFAYSTNTVAECQLSFTAVLQ